MPPGKRGVGRRAACRVGRGWLQVQLSHRLLAITDGTVLAGVTCGHTQVGKILLWSGTCSPRHIGNQEKTLSKQSENKGLGQKRRFTGVGFPAWQCVSCCNRGKPPGSMLALRFLLSFNKWARCQTSCKHKENTTLSGKNTHFCGRTFSSTIECKRCG